MLYENQVNHKYKGAYEGPDSCLTSVYSLINKFVEDRACRHKRGWDIEDYKSARPLLLLPQPWTRPLAIQSPLYRVLTGRLACPVHTEKTPPQAAISLLCRFQWFSLYIQMLPSLFSVPPLGLDSFVPFTIFAARL